MKPADLATAGPPGSLPSVALRRLAAHALEVEPAAALGGEPWPALLQAAKRERMLGLLNAAIDDGALELEEDDQLAEARREALNALGGDLTRERELVQLVELLGSFGVDCRALKGAAVAHLDYPDPSWRSFADVDLLVRSESWDAVMRELQARGWQRQFPEPRPGFERRFVKSMMLKRGYAGVELDLHRTFALGPFGLTIELADLWSGSERFELAGGHVLEALDPEVRFLHACFHAALGDLPPRLVPLRDVLQMALSGRLELERILALTTSWQSEAVVARAVGLACSVLMVEPAAHPVLARLGSLGAPRRQLQLLDSYLSPGRSYVRLTVAATRAIARPSDKLRYVAALAAPSHDFVAPRYRNRRARYAAATRAMLAGRSFGHSPSTPPDRA